VRESPTNSIWRLRAAGLLSTAPPGAATKPPNVLVSPGVSLRLTSRTVCVLFDRPLIQCVVLPQRRE
jgi:hypothetical protein